MLLEIPTCTQSPGSVMKAPLNAFPVPLYYLRHSRDLSIHLDVQGSRSYPSSAFSDRFADILILKEIPSPSPLFAGRFASLFLGGSWRGLVSGSRVGHGCARVGRRGLRVWSQRAPPAQCLAPPRPWVGAPKRAGRSLPARGHRALGSVRHCGAFSQFSFK